MRLIALTCPIFHLSGWRRENVGWICALRYIHPCIYSAGASRRESRDPARRLDARRGSDRGGGRAWVGDCVHRLPPLQALKLSVDKKLAKVFGLIKVAVKRLALMSLLSIFTFAGCSEKPANKIVHFNVSADGIAPANKPVAVKAFQAFWNRCPEMASLVGDIETAKLEVSENSWNVFGWRKPIEFITKFKDHPSDSRLVEWGAFANTCYYTMGGGSKPGVFTGKGGCARICNMTKQSEGQYFSDVPQLQFLDDLNTPEYRQALAEAKTKFDSDLAAEMSGVKKGDGDAISNVAYLYSHGALGVPADNYKECVWLAAAYIKRDYSVADFIPAKQRKEMEADHIETERQRVRRTCSANLSVEQAASAINEGKKTAHDLPGSHVTRREIFD